MSNMFWTARGIGRAIENAVNNAATPPSPVPRQETRLLEERVDQLLLVCSAMWELICEKTDLTQEDLMNRVAMIDARDGVADSKMTRTPQKCPKCERVVAPRHERCLYCGFQLPIDSVFRTI